jgi:hypothetical protein
MTERKKTSIIWQLDTEDLRELVSESTSLASVLSYFNLNNQGGNAKTLKQRLDAEGIDYSHIPQGKSSNREFARYFPYKRPLGEVLSTNSTYDRGHLKRRLIKEGLLENVCLECGLNNEWNGKPLVLVLDHINGENNDNRLENLRLLCPNCNSQTDTFAGRNQRIK